MLHPNWTVVEGRTFLVERRGAELIVSDPDQGKIGPTVMSAPSSVGWNPRGIWS